MIDFLRIQEVMKSIADELEGTDLNVLEAFGENGASAEKLAELLAAMLSERLEEGGNLHKVEVTEAQGCTAAYYPKA